MVLASASGDVSGLLHPGDCMGQLALLPDLAARRRPATATALKPTDVVALACRDLALACRDHPASGSLVQVSRIQLVRGTSDWVGEGVWRGGAWRCRPGTTRRRGHWYRWAEVTLCNCVELAFSRVTAERLGLAGADRRGNGNPCGRVSNL